MAESFASFKNTGTSKIVFLLSMIVFLFCFMGWSINVYHFPFIGAIFEIFWLPIILMTFSLPIFSLILWFKEKFNLGSFYFYSILSIGVTVLFKVLSHK